MPQCCGSSKITTQYSHKLSIESLIRAVCFQAHSNTNRNEQPDATYFPVATPGIAREKKGKTLWFNAESFEQ